MFGGWRNRIDRRFRNRYPANAACRLSIRNENGGWAVAVPHLIATVLHSGDSGETWTRVFCSASGLMNAAGSLAGALIHVWVNNPILSIVLCRAESAWSGTRIGCGLTGELRGSPGWSSGRWVDQWATREEFGRLRCWVWESRDRLSWLLQQQLGLPWMPFASPSTSPQNQQEVSVPGDCCRHGRRGVGNVSR
jgi:hypothetical protein